MSRFLLAAAAAAAAAIAAALAEPKQQQQQLLSGIRGKRLQVCIDLSSTLTPHPSAEARHSTTPPRTSQENTKIPGIPRSLVCQDPWYAKIPGMLRTLGSRFVENDCKCALTTA